MTIAIIGHSNWKLDDFINHLVNSGVTMLMDVRSKPASRFCPWFNGRNLEPAIKEAGIQYRWRGERLGGFSNGDKMAETLDFVVDWSQKNPDRLIAMMCAERPPQDCHRFYWLARYIAETSDQTIRSLTVHAEDWFPTIEDYTKDKRNIEDWAAAPWLQAAVDAKKAARA